MDDPTNPRDRSTPAGQPVDDASALMPRPPEERHAPPIDVDEREGYHEPSTTIPLASHDDPATAGDLDDQINETLPAPTEAPNGHEPAPADDIEAQIDDTLPEPSAEAPGTGTDAGELDAETAYLLDEPDQAGPDTATDVLTSLTMDEPGVMEDDEADDGPPVNDESIHFRTGADADEPGVTAAGTATATPLMDTGTTTCPVCGQETDALRFCGHCGAPLTRGRSASAASTPLGRAQAQLRDWFEPLGDWTRSAVVRTILGAGAVLVLLALLSNSGGLAFMIAAAILPLILVISFMQRDVFEPEPPLVIAGLAVAGVLTGAVLGWLGAWLVANNWFDEGVLNFGAAGFGGRFAEAAGNAPFVVWALNGVVLPAIALAAIAGIPVALRQSMSLRNEVMDGLTLAGAVAGGYTLGTAMVFAAPMLSNGGPASDASGWTLTTIGLTILRPLIWTLSGAMLGAGVWLYLRTSNISRLLIPFVAGVGAPLLYTLVSIQLASTGLWLEVLWGVVVAVAVVVLYRMVLGNAIALDRQVLGSDDTRVVCPNCHQVTPSGAFCAHCGQPLR